jgi:dTDP-4-dehydrorhamnose 3,5-epimerase-like enzyme
MKIKGCKIIEFPRIMDRRGNLSFIEGENHVPFEIKRLYYLYDVPSGATRGGHAHRAMECVIIALSGSFDLKLDDGFTKESVFMNKPYLGLYLPSGIWREIANFSSNSVALVIASTIYDEGEYIRQYEVFKKMVCDGTLDREKSSVH